MKHYSHILLFSVVFILILTAGCDSQLTENSEPADKPSLAYTGPMDATTGASESIEVSIEDLMSTINEKMAAQGLDVRVYKAEYITAGESGEVGAEILAKDVGNKQLGADFVPNDPRRTWSNNGLPGDTDDITYAIDQTVDATPFSPGVSAAEATEAIQNAMGTWDGQKCSDLSLTQNSDGGVDIGWIAAFNGLGGSFAVLGDIQHAGFRDINFGGGILGVAFTLVFAGTDIDNNGKADVAFREIYYDPSWQWTIGSFPGVDIETVALHEAGHGLSQAHFGNIFLKKGELKPSPLAVMNALYSGEQRGLKGTDKGGHCSNWAQWPNN